MESIQLNQASQMHARLDLGARMEYIQSFLCSLRRKDGNDILYVGVNGKDTIRYSNNQLTDKHLTGRIL